MREIKFRGKTLFSREWRYGSLERDEHVDTTTIIKNLINKYRELEKERDSIYADYQDLGKEKLKLEEENQVVRGANNYWVMKFCEANNKNKEQEKVIELMAEAFKQDDIRSEEEIIEHFRKKAKGE